MTTREKEKALMDKYSTIEEIMPFTEDGAIKEGYKHLNNVEKLAALSLFMENENWHDVSETLINVAYDIEFGND